MMMSTQPISRAGKRALFFVSFLLAYELVIFALIQIYACFTLTNPLWQYTLATDLVALSLCTFLVFCAFYGITRRLPGWLLTYSILGSIKISFIIISLIFCAVQAFGGVPIPWATSSSRHEEVHLVKVYLISTAAAAVVDVVLMITTVVFINQARQVIKTEAAAIGYVAMPQGSFHAAEGFTLLPPVYIYNQAQLHEYLEWNPSTNSVV